MPTTEPQPRPTHVWIFDSNHRVYADNRISSAPIWRRHWVRHEITGETSRSWLVGPDWARRKIPKNPERQNRRMIAWSEAEIDALTWAHEHRYRIVRAVEHLENPALLRQVADLVGYQP